MVWKRISEADVEEVATAEVGVWDIAGVESAGQISYVYGEPEDDL